MLYEFIAENREEIIARAQKKTDSRTSSHATPDELSNAVPIFLDQIVVTLRFSGVDDTAVGDSASAHGGDQLKRGLTVGQVVHGYGDICQVITELAAERRAPITTEEFHVFNRCLDEAIARAVTEYMHQRDLTLSEAGAERLERLAHELRNRLSGALLAFDILKRGNVGVCGATGGVLDRSLNALCDIVDRSFSSEMHLEIGAVKSEPKVTVDPVEPDVFMDVDRQIVHAA
jgi:hypothetical protein